MNVIYLKSGYASRSETGGIPVNLLTEAKSGELIPVKSNRMVPEADQMNMCAGI